MEKHYTRTHKNTAAARKRRRQAIQRCAAFSFAAAAVAAICLAPSLEPRAVQAVALDAPAKTAMAQRGEDSSAEAVPLKQLAPEAAPAPAPETPVPQGAEPVEPEWFEVNATAYCSCAKCCGEWAYKRSNGIVYTASGAEAQQGVTIAADWDVFPVGTTLYIDGLGERVVQDCGGAIDGHDIDVYFSDHQQALEFGRQSLRAYVVEQ